MKIVIKTTLKKMLQDAKHSQAILQRNKANLYWLEFKNLIKKRNIVTPGSYIEKLKIKWNEQ